MPRKTLTGARFSMKATILHQGDLIPDPIDIEKYGEWVERQDPLTGEIVRVWIPYETPVDDPDTDWDESVKFATIPCLVRGIVDGGIRVAGTTERFGDTYQNLEFVKMWTPARSLPLSKSDRVTNISNRDGSRIWVDEEFAAVDEIPKATVFNVQGVTPLFDAFNKHTENFILLEKAEVASD